MVEKSPIFPLTPEAAANLSAELVGARGGSTSLERLDEIAQLANLHAEAVDVQAQSVMDTTGQSSAEAPYADYPDKILSALIIDPNIPREHRTAIAEYVESRTNHQDTKTVE